MIVLFLKAISSLRSFRDLIQAPLKSFWAQFRSKSDKLQNWYFSDIWLFPQHIAKPYSHFQNFTSLKLSSSNEFHSPAHY